MAQHRDGSIIEGLVAEILATLSDDQQRKLGGAATAGEEVKGLAKLDYARPLRRSFDRCEIEEILAEARKTIWPHWNRTPARLGSVDEFVKAFSHLGIDVRPAEFSWPDGQALLGFYVRRTQQSPRPLICVNTAHHPAIIGASFAHEMGHHLLAELFDWRKEPVSFQLYTGYAEHLNEPTELAADILIGLGIFPAGIARQIFGKGQKSRQTASSEQTLVDATFEKVVDSICMRYGLNFDAAFWAPKKLQYLAALIHYARLRQTLLNEYDL